MDGVRATSPGHVPIKQQEIKPQHGKPDNQPVSQAKPEDTGVDTVAITQALSANTGNLKPGETISVSMGKKEVATITKEGPNNWDKMGRAMKTFGMKTVDITKEAIEIDPAFAFRETIEVAKEPLTQAVPETIKSMALKGLYPGMRAGVLFLDAKKAWNTLKDPEANLVDKIVDVGHCVTDVGGLVGAVAPLVGLAIPGANILAATAVVGDIISFGYHALRWVSKKYEAHKKIQAEQENSTIKPQNPDELNNPNKKSNLESIVEKESAKLKSNESQANHSRPPRRNLETIVNEG
ncbi:MAG: hypothetical protein ACLFQV_11530 [Vulcanimicrobiota bacterium]